MSQTGTEKDSIEWARGFVVWGHLPGSWADNAKIVSPCFYEEVYCTYHPLNELRYSEEIKGLANLEGIDHGDVVWGDRFSNTFEIPMTWLEEKKNEGG